MKLPLKITASGIEHAGNKFGVERKFKKKLLKC